MKLVRLIGLIGIMLALCLAGCDDYDQDAYRDAINAALVTRQAIIPVPGKPIVNKRNKSTPQSLIEDLSLYKKENFSKAQQDSFSRQTTYANLLASAGILTVTQGQVTSVNMRGEKVTQYGLIINFTDQYLKDVKVFSDGKIGLIIGYVGVDKILHISEIKKLANGQEQVIVTFNKTLISKPEWVTDAIIEYSGIKNHIGGQQSLKLIKDDSGWVVQGFKGRRINLNGALK